MSQRGRPESPTPLAHTDHSAYLPGCLSPWLLPPSRSPWLAICDITWLANAAFAGAVGPYPTSPFRAIARRGSGRGAAPQWLLSPLLLAKSPGWPLAL